MFRRGCGGCRAGFPEVVGLASSLDGEVVGAEGALRDGVLAALPAEVMFLPEGAQTAFVVSLVSAFIGLGLV